MGQELARRPALSLVRRPSGAEEDTIGGGRAATLSGLTVPLSAFHRVIVDKRASFLSLDEACCGPWLTQWSATLPPSSKSIARSPWRDNVTRPRRRRRTSDDPSTALKIPPRIPPRLKSGRNTRVTKLVTTTRQPRHTAESINARLRPGESELGHFCERFLRAKMCRLRTTNQPFRVVRLRPRELIAINP